MLGEVKIMSGQLPRNIIFTATVEQLSCEHCRQHLWSTAVSLTHLSSAGVIAAIDCLYRDAEYLGIEFRNPDGALYIIPETWELFPEENEAGRRWMSNFRKADKTGMRPRYFCRCIQKLRCIELLVQCTVARYRRGPETPRCSYTHYPLGW
jgi:hypothetical protein